MISAYLRINKKEEAELMKLSNALNKDRLNNGLSVMKESEILHKLLYEAFKKAKSVNGELVIE